MTQVCKRLQGAREDDSENTQGSALQWMSQSELGRAIDQMPPAVHPDATRCASTPDRLSVTRASESAPMLQMA